MWLSRALHRRHSVLPGFDLALGFTVLYLSFIVLVPLSAIEILEPTVDMTLPDDPRQGSAAVGEWH